MEWCSVGGAFCLRVTSWRWLGLRVYTDDMNAWLPRLLALFLALTMVPGVSEVVESAVHLVTEGHLAHTAPDGDHHEPTGPEHGCTPIFHFCGCHANLAFVGPGIPPRTVLHASRYDVPLKLPAEPSGFWPAVERPPRA